MLTRTDHRISSIRLKSTFLMLISALLIIPLSSCDEDAENLNDGAIDIPTSFRVDVPASLTAGTSGARIAAVDPDKEIDPGFEGSGLYEALRAYITIADGSAEIVETLMKTVKAIRRNNLTTFDFISDDDKREKSVEIIESPTVNGVSWKAGLVMKDKEADAVAFTLYWNPSPLEGIATFNVYQFDQTNDILTQNTFYQIEYSEATTRYEQEMTVSISGIPKNNEDKWYVKNMKMTVGKSGDIVEVVGNSIHPTAPFFQDQECNEGLSYSFVAKADEAKKISLASLGLPPSCQTNTDSVFTSFSLFTILDNWLLKVFPNSTEDARNLILKDAQSPAYFSAAKGFIGAGTDAKPADFETDFVDLSGLSSFVPKDISDLSIAFPQ